MTHGKRVVRRFPGRGMSQYFAPREPDKKEVKP